MEGIDVRLLRCRPFARFAVTALVSAVFLVSGCRAWISPDAGSLSISPASALVVGVGETQTFTLTATGEDGEALETAAAVWRVDDRSVAHIDEGGTATGVGAGVTVIRVDLDDLSASAALEVHVPEAVADYSPGVSYTGRRAYVEYIPGRLPVVLSAPHGGSLEPSEIPDRTHGTLVTDRSTTELTMAVRQALLDLTGFAPHVIFSHLDRVKLDPNREIGEAAQGNPFAELAWKEYHTFIERARASVAPAGGGMYLDIHGHGHPVARLELGYLLSAEQLDQSDAALDLPSVMEQTSIRDLGERSPLPFSELLRGTTSFGGLLESEGVPVVPSPAEPSPGSDPFFSGGYSTGRHGSLTDSEVVSGIQIEHHYPGLRDTATNRTAYAATLALVIRAFMLEHFGFFEP